MTLIGLLHPGSMGAAIGRALREVGHDVSWASEGRSVSSRERADGFMDMGSLGNLCAAVEVIICVCPPHAAEEMAEHVATSGFGGVYLEANALAPRSSVEIGVVLESNGIQVVDGAIMGPPPTQPGTTRLYLSGRGRESVLRLFEDTILQVVDAGPALGAASGVKMCVEAWRKPQAPMLAAIRAAARFYGIEGLLLHEWGVNAPELLEFSRSEPSRVAPKAWRFAGEMREVDLAMADAGTVGNLWEQVATMYDSFETLYQVDSDAPGGTEGSGI